MARRRFQHPPVHRTKTRHPRWFFRARVDVKKTEGIRRIQKPYYLGEVKEIGKRQAEHLRDAILKDGINKPQMILQSQVPFGEVIKAFEADHLPTVRDVTADNYRRIIKNWIAPTFAGKRLCDIEPLMVQQWVNKMPFSTATRKLHIGLLSVIWGKATDWNYTQQVFPGRRVSIGPRRAINQKVIPTIEQWRVIVSLLPEPTKIMAELAVATGMRVSEIRGLRVRSVDLANRRLFVEGRLDTLGCYDDPKSERGRRVLPLGPMAERLASRVVGRDGGALVFHDAQLYVCMQRQLRNAARKAGIVARGFGWHALRRFANTYLRKSGASSLDAQDQLGHASQYMNDLYIVAETEDYRRREQHVLRMQELLLGEVKGGVQ